jgi:predicted RNA binding protein YcfA (HicA-like mRNA interferase family)
MARVPRGLSGRRLRTILEGVGFRFRRQKGSHIILMRDEPFALAVIPDRPALKSGTLSQILKDADLSVEQLLKLLSGNGGAE